MNSSLNSGTNKSRAPNRRNQKGLRVHRGMYVADRFWALCWYAGKISDRSRPDYIAHAIREALRKDKVIDDAEQIPRGHIIRIKALLKTNPPDKRTVLDMAKALNIKV